MERSDILVENSRPNVNDRFGNLVQSIRTVNPRPAYANISGYGEDVKEIIRDK
ncbi:CoA transferase [Bradyrhizobium sp. RDT10]